MKAHLHCPIVSASGDDNRQYRNIIEKEGSKGLQKERTRLSGSCGFV